MSIVSASASPQYASASVGRALARFAERDARLADVERVQHHQAAVDQPLRLVVGACTAQCARAGCTVGGCGGAVAAGAGDGGATGAAAGAAPSSATASTAASERITTRSIRDTATASRLRPRAAAPPPPSRRARRPRGDRVRRGAGRAWISRRCTSRASGASYSAACRRAVSTLTTMSPSIRSGSPSHGRERGRVGRAVERLGRIQRKAQHVGRRVLAAVLAVELAHLGVAHERQRDARPALADLREQPLEHVRERARVEPDAARAVVRDRSPRARVRPRVRARAGCTPRRCARRADGARRRSRRAARRRRRPSR